MSPPAKLLYCTQSAVAGQKLAEIDPHLQYAPPASDAPVVALPGHRRDGDLRGTPQSARLCPSHRHFVSVV
ncbi:MAG TPA: hypothetical protein VNH11_33445 [Pirellulales bacterium]|nr:hypothetical protein [Pirellulales bacterium]